MVYLRLVWGNLPAFGPYLLVGFFLLRALPRSRVAGSRSSRTAWPIAPTRPSPAGMMIPTAAMTCSPAVWQGDGETDPVWVGCGAGVDSVHGDADDRLVDGQQGVDLLVDVGGTLGSQNPTVQDRGLDGQVRGFRLPPAVVQGHQFLGGVATVVEQAGDQPPLFAGGGAVGPGHGDPRLDDPDLEAAVAQHR